MVYHEVNANPHISPTNHQVWETCDNIIAQAANPIFGKLYFYDLVSGRL